MSTPGVDPRPRPPDNSCRLVFTGVQSSFAWAMIMWLRMTASQPSGAALASALTTINSVWNTNLTALMPSTCILQQIEGVWILPNEGEIVQFNTTSRQGTNAGAQLPNISTCAVANWRIDKYYRGGKPRSYLPGVPTTSCTDGVHLTTAAITATQSAMSAFMQGINAITATGLEKVELGTVSFVKAKQWRNPPVFWPYLGVSVRSTLGVQRRRLLT